ncbi:hypothetical protein C1I95_30840 [Micromonospora craterilacus]|uniref:Uncharacterized protein n=1 Tax=Micromonospora craterilacus TaxID=1655439 RepID=A0A2W2D9W9_9ACTN|nr:hypothetical protein [Micromonospora craterilacus]PZG07613.1 hypothetical protein C1I95_30840 [Micromonospora craterilacus]
MRDEMTFVERLHHDLQDVRWPEPAELRTRARRRRRRTVLTAAASVLVVAAASAVVMTNLAAPPPQLATPLMEPSVRAFAEIPLASLVQPGDLRVNTDPPLGEAGLGEPVRLDVMLLACHEEQGLTTRWETSRYSRSQTLLRSRPHGAEPRPADLVLNQDVYRLAPQVAAGLFARIDVLLAPCATWRSKGDAQWGDRIAQAEASHQWEVTDRDFAGDEAVLIRHTTRIRNLDTGETRAPGRPETTAVVRVGDLVTVMGLGRDGTESELRRVATVAAGRLCAAANPPC